jgi:metal-sulfur cluster biosynthetic enzyme
MASSKLTDKQVLKALDKCCDPELGVSVVDLGLIRNVDVDGGEVKLQIIFGSQCCAFHPMVAQRIHQAISELPGVKGVEIEVDRTTVWKPDMMSEKGRKVLGY